MKKLNIVKFGGSLSKNEEAKKNFLDRVASISKKERVVLVHGGGPEIGSWLARLNIQTMFVNGLRYTDYTALEVVEMVLSGKVNKGLVAELNKRGAKAVGISGKDGKSVLCRRLPELGFVGEPLKVDITLAKDLLAGGFLPVMSSLAFDKDGNTLNVNADSMAMAMASALKADRLILLTDVRGVLDAEKKTINEIKTKDAEKLIENGTVTGGMIPKLRACAKSVKAGVKEVWIADGSSDLKEPEGTLIHR
ncbi:MAG: acetylglutamate kinase [Endomicrobiales bacterium]|nr:acetylglutamate kinase [Endomicrobiales bacterium]